MNFKITIEYDGTRYDGWQRQKSTDQTIQGKIEKVLSRMTGKEIEIDGAGRTDAGVHAKAQIANVHLAPQWKTEDIFSSYEAWEKEYKAIENEYENYDFSAFNVVFLRHSISKTQKFMPNITANTRIYIMQ